MDLTTIGAGLTAAAAIWIAIMLNEALPRLKKDPLAELKAIRRVLEERLPPKSE